MALITRLSRLFQADMHAVLDKIEEPAALLKQSIREMEESVLTDERHVRLSEHRRQQLEGKRDQLAETLAELDEKCAFCFQSGKDDLARAFVKRKLETLQMQQLLAEKIAVLDEQTRRLTKRFAEHQAQLAAMKQKAEVFLENGAVSSYPWENPQVTVRDEDVEVAFLKEKQKWSAS
ncbi:PspA/IM30 family protein [Methylomicrobium sp. RS1]|uniref:PspA/IM30 family protein n=1 Tax=Candidatus Methylomicrobium oryzae TaxID=2802053 RepID=UPI001920BDC9|nr:PspA/IM30 family protein [Methylomicrobium sp. RS1]MBL1265420.1 PspA/IM30 family protein [Methylomicrobium sp. RS1]